MTVTLPLVAIPADYRNLSGAGVHSADDSYVRTVLDAAGAIPVILPALAGDQDFPSIFAAIDGILLTGSQSNVAPALYGDVATVPGAMQDVRRDASNMPLIHAAIAAGIPLLAICRGFQELNVAFGGSLHQKLHALPGRLDHRAPSGQPVDIQFAAAHMVDFTENGLLHGLIGTDSAMVNSVHWQGANRLGEGLIVEAVAPDGTVEAVRVEAANDFALAVQWHPEHRPAENPVSRAIFAAFRQAVLRRQTRRLSGL
jgi:putative glutamine amidotransferase